MVPVSDTEGPESGLDRLDSVSVRVDELVKDGAKRRRLRRSLILDKFINTNNLHPSDQGRHPNSEIYWARITCCGANGNDKLAPAE
jgi:hypothetical protein